MRPSPAHGSRWLIDVATLDAAMRDGRRPHVAVVMDVATRRIITSQVGSDRELAVMTALRTAVRGSGAPELIYVDSGCPLPAKALADLGIRVEVMGALQAACRMGPIERYFNSLRVTLGIGGAA
ncbi:hypothetical protein [Ancylobacter sp. G4_0304]|uniref:hypothetical protein n=1 Tax=Ancylobacter sp. G4_0304 TaxID=3114289 RepID=UPI0039C64C37